MATMKRCLAQLSIRAGGQEEHLWPGLEVNFERELAPGYTVAHAIVGRESCFEDVYVTGTLEQGVAHAPLSSVLIDPADPALERATIQPLPAAAAPLEEHE